MKSLKKTGIVVLIFLVALFVGYKYLYKGHRDIGSEEAKYTAEAKSLTDEFNADNLAATKKYLNTVIIVKGIVTEIEEEGITLNKNVFLQLENKINSNLKLNNSVTVKGRFIGYDELLEYVKIDQCNILNY